MKKDMKIQYGKVTINIHAPKISEKENQRRKDELNRVISVICNNMIKRGEL